MIQRALNLAPGGGSAPASADQVSYDNTQSGLEATEVQSAIDEMMSDLNDYIEFDATTMWEDRNGFTTVLNGFRKGNLVRLAGTTTISGKGRYPQPSDYADNNINGSCVGYITDERFIPILSDVSLQQISQGGNLQGIYAHYICGKNDGDKLVGAILEITNGSTASLVPNYNSSFTLRFVVLYLVD